MLFSASYYATYCDHYNVFLAPESMKKLISRAVHNWPKFFISVLPTGPKAAQKQPKSQFLFEFACELKGNKNTLQSD
jgi:hypothetical protein